ncbi:DUF1330 domain-containing protein [Halomonas sp. M5N1S15]|nr:DUF1330 domain-containing protein [Halomonas alkalisoli]
MLGFPSLEQAQARYRSEAYRCILPLRTANAVGDVGHDVDDRLGRHAGNGGTAEVFHAALAGEVGAKHPLAVSQKDADAMSLAAIGVGSMTIAARHAHVLVEVATER